MIKRINNVLIWSENYKRLADWYTKNLEFKNTKEYNHPEDTGILLKKGVVGLWIGQHSKVKGVNRDPHRHMIDFLVDSVGKSYDKLKKKGVKFYGPPFKNPVSDRYVVTLFDEDGNIIQLVGNK